MGEQQTLIGGKNHGVKPRYPLLHLVPHLLYKLFQPSTQISTSNREKLHMVRKKRVMRKSTCEMGNCSSTHCKRRSENLGPTMASISPTCQIANKRHDCWL
jgi:hypothetical protein